MILEVVLATVANLQNLFLIGSILSGVGVGILIILCLVSLDTVMWDEPLYPTLKKPLICASLALLILSTLACLPSMEDVWKVRIALIKLQLASPENITKGTDTIEKIAKALECKYLVDCKEVKK